MRSDDLEELARAARNDARSFGLLYDRLYDTVYRYVLGRVGSTHTAEDITADTFMEAMRRIDRYRPRGGGVRAWVLRIARNDTIDHLRRNQRRPVAPLDAAEQVPADDAPEPEAIGRVESMRVLAAMGALTDEQRDVVSLRYAADLPHAEIARILRKSEGAVRVMLHRAVRSLERHLKETE